VTASVSVRLDDDVRATLESEAQSQGIGLAILLRQVAADYPNVILVPLTDDPALVIPGLTETIEPTPENACTKRCFALAPLVSSTASARVRATGSKVTAEQLARIRGQVAETIGLR